MPKNPRPSGLFGDLDYGWKGTTLNERIQAQNQWDLLEAQEKANELEEEKLAMQEEMLEEERRNADKIADATRKAEEDRKKHQLDLEEMHQNYDKEMRYNKLCDDLGLDYEDLCDLELLFNYNDKEAKQIFEDFCNFRKEHYSRGMEILFMKLKLNFGIISKDDIINNGSNDDYIDFIYGIIMDNNDLIKKIKQDKENNLLYEIIEYVVDTQEVSTQDIGRKFNIPFNIVKNMIYEMEIRGIILDDKVLMTKEKWNEIMNRVEDNTSVQEQNYEPKQSYEEKHNNRSNQDYLAEQISLNLNKYKSNNETKDD